MAQKENQLNKLIAAACDIREKPDEYELAFMARMFIQATLPHSDPGPVNIWGRRNGYLQLSVKPDWEFDKNTGKGRCVGVPYGTIPRLVLFWITTEAVRTKNPRLELGHSLSDFMRQLGLIPSGGRWGTIPRLKEQLRRLFRAKISLDYDENANMEAWSDMQVTSKGALWWDHKHPDQLPLWQSWIELSPDFFNAVTKAPVPLDMRVLKAIKKSPLALDLYAWASYKSFAVTKKKQAAMVPWRALQKQLGADYGDVKNFKRKAKGEFEKIMALCPDMKLEYVRGGIEVKPGRQAIAYRKASSGDKPGEN